MSLASRVREALPGIVPEDAYDDDYPGDVAGHVASGARIDPASDVVSTPFGIDHAFDGDGVEDRAPREGHEGIGAAHVNDLIAETVRESKDRENRHPTTDVADGAVFGSMVLADGAPRRLLIRNPNRKAVVVTNQSNAGTLYLGANSGILVAGPNTVYLPPGTGRTFTNTCALWVVGVAGQIVDWVEENYV